jgi:lysophospholipid acyltransferase (LPLAT)-like uncharacterized protein
MNKYKITGILLSGFIKILIKTTKYKVIESEEAVKHKQAVIIFWHRKIIPTMLGTDFLDKKSSLVSSSKDGDILEEVLKRFDNLVVRGSSNRDSVKSLKQILKLIKTGFSVGIAIDGPRGPIYEPKSGALYIAMKTGLPMIPIGGYTNKKWIFKKAWDKFELPKFFSKSCYYVGEPLYFSKDSDIESSMKLIKEKLHEVNRTAKEYYDKEYR